MNDITEIPATDLSLDHIGYLIEVRRQVNGMPIDYAGQLLGYEFDSKSGIYKIILTPHQSPREVLIENTSEIKILGLRKASGARERFDMAVPKSSVC